MSKSEQCVNCGESLQTLLDTVPRVEVWEEMVAHSEGKCKQK